MNKVGKPAIVEPNFIAALEVKVIASYSCYLAYSEKGNEIAAACNITEAHTAASTMAFIHMPCGRTALEVAMNEPRFSKVIDRLLKDGSFMAIHDYRRVTK